MKTSNSAQSIVSQATFQAKLDYFFNTGLTLNLPFAIWKSPNKSSIRATLQLDHQETSIDEIESAPTGFLFHPFEKSDDHRRMFIRSEVSLDSERNEVLLSPSYTGGQDHYQKFHDTFLKLAEESNFDFRPFLATAPVFSSEKKEYVNLVNQCKSSIENGSYQKIVPSRRGIHNTERDFHPVEEFFNLAEAYENAFVSLVYIPNHGLWIGATPELLISVEDRTKFKTISLAGTQELLPKASIAQTAWMQKEIEEQALVSRYIVNCFKQIRLRDFKESGPKTVKAGNLIHLKTIFEVDMSAVGFPQLGTVMLDLLHPTSAVCGMPMKPAAKFLKENEGYDREYYSGYLGPVNDQNNTQIYVNLRCARIYKHKMVLFAGAGVTEDSDAEKEWDETELKAKTLLNILNLIEV